MPSKKSKNFIETGICFLCWASPILNFEIFFPLGAFFVYQKNFVIRHTALASLFLQLFFYTLFVPFELWSYYKQEFELHASQLLSIYNFEIKICLFFLGLFLFLLHKHFIKKKYNYLSLNYTLKGEYKKKYKILSFLYFFIFFCLSFLLINNLLLIDSFEMTFNPIRNLQENILNFLSFSFFFLFLISNKKNFFLFRKIFLITIHQIRAKKPISFLHKNKYSYAKMRNLILPGWGNLYFGSIFNGFSLIFTYLLFLFLFFITFFSYLDFIFGIRFLGSFGLKSTLNQKLFLDITQQPYLFLIFLLFLLFCYLISFSILKIQFNGKNSESRFLANFHYSLLFHLILLFLLFIVPFSVYTKVKQKNSLVSKKTQSLDFYFIDDQIAENIKGLNGSHIAGSSKENATNQKNFLNTKRGNTATIKKKIGQKNYQTYSNYISAKMRGPELFMKYWKQAPENYSCVVSYIINSDGKIIHAEIVEPSSYSQQDQLTINLIYSLSPLLSVPDITGDVKITELFWNGDINPDNMPTDLQKRLVLNFDGRLIERL